MLDNFLSAKTPESLLSEPDTLAVIEFDQQAVDQAVPVRLSTLQSSSEHADKIVEVWKAPNAIINSGVSDNCHWRCSDDYLFLSVNLDCGTDDNPQEVSARAYQSILQTIKDSDYPHLLRFWNMVPRINVGAGDQENYKLFCNGRLAAFDQFGILESQYPAATAVGHYGDGITVYAMSSKLKPSHIANPRQVEAFDYPRQYGPSSPSFARATRLSNNEQSIFFISGTASILGHDSVHIDDLHGQLHTTNDNILYLLKEAELKRSDIHSLRVYLRNPEDAAITQESIRSWYPDAHLVITHADICRADLLVEIECYCVSA